MNLSWGLGAVNLSWGLGAVNLNWGLGAVNLSWGPGACKLKNLGPGACKLKLGLGSRGRGFFPRSGLRRRTPKRCEGGGL